MTLLVSKTKVDAAARRLAAAPAEANSEDEALVDVWRELHAQPLQQVRESIARRLDRAGVRAPVVGRLKRKPQIVRKLGVSSTRLTQMQDIGGCRAVMKSPMMVDSALDRIRSRAAPHYEVDRVSDYRDEGRTGTGYRGLHLVLVKNERSIEVQLRTNRQHAWAEGVERIGTLLDCDLKWGKGPAEAVDFFELASHLFWSLENGKNPAPQDRTALRRRNVALDLLVEDSNSHGSSTSKISPKSTRTTGTNLWLVIYNWEKAEFEKWMDLGTRVSEANAIYSRYEREYSTDEGYEVVLIGADSPESFEITHSHYFAKSRADIDPHGFFEEIL